jgi:hypothetical protein
MSDNGLRKIVKVLRDRNGAVGQDKATETIILRVEPPDRKLLPSEVEIRTEGKRLNALTISDPSTPLSMWHS